MAEALVSLAAGTLLIGASAAALSTTGSLINRTESKTSLRHNALNGQRLMRSEIERSLHLLIATPTSTPTPLADTNLHAKQYAKTLKACQSLAETRPSQLAFKPLFGIRMASLDEPIIYGISSVARGTGYSIERCGLPFTMSGRYGDQSDRFLSPVIEHIGVMPCTKQHEHDCDPHNQDAGRSATLNRIVQNLDVQFRVIDGHGERTPFRAPYEPALALETDASRKLVKFVDPDPRTSQPYSYLELTNSTRSLSHLNLHFSAYARASSQEPSSPGGEDGLLNGNFFRNIRSKRMRFLVDGSGSMSACILWGSGRGQNRIYWTGQRYIQTRTICALTRMEALQNELLMLLQQLPDDTRISIEAFSSRGYRNHREWSRSSDGLVTIGSKGTRESAARFINSLDDGNVLHWGATYPWDGLDESLADKEADTLYFLTDGEPSSSRRGGRWTSQDRQQTVDHYSTLNRKRDRKLAINSTAFGLSSEWMQNLSSQNDGAYLMINKDYVTIANQ